MRRLAISRFVADALLPELLPSHSPGRRAFKNILLLLVFVGTGCLNHVNSFFCIYFMNAEKAGSYALYEAGRAILVAGLSLGLVAGLGYGLWGLVVPSLAIQAVLLGVFLVRFGLVRPGIDLGMLKEMFLYGWPLGAMIFAGIITTNVDRLMLGKMLPEDKAMGVLGVYGRAQGLAIVLFLFMTTVQNVYAPRWNKILFQIEGQGPRSLAALFTEYVCLVIVPAAMLALFCQEIVRVMTPPAYHGMTPLVISPCSASSVSR
jgi:O-antigen/teichoic acid export membrane protein